MPANKKHLTASPWQRLLKISAGLFGGYLVTLSFHFLLMRFLDKGDVYVTMFFTGFIAWAGLMVLAFLARKGWKIWVFYLSLSLLFLSPYLIDLMYVK